MFNFLFIAGIAILALVIFALIWAPKFDTKWYKLLICIDLGL